MSIVNLSEDSFSVTPSLPDLSCESYRLCVSLVIRGNYIMLCPLLQPMGIYWWGPDTQGDGRTASLSVGGSGFDITASFVEGGVVMLIAIIILMMTGAGNVLYEE